VNLNRTRIQLTLIYGILSALAVGGISWYAVGVATDRIYDGAERETEAVIRDLALQSFETSDDEGWPYNTWHVNLEEQWTDPLGEVWVEPPLFTLAESADEYPTHNEFQFDGSTWLAYIELLDDEGTEAIVTIVDLAPFDDDAASTGLRIWLAATGSIVAAVAAGYWIAGRSLRPAHAALRQQRDFIADAAHELRTPLAVIQASASHSLSREREGNAYRESLEEIRAAAERAGHGVSELLELARLEAGQAALRLAPLRLDLLAEEVASSIRVDGVVLEAGEGEALVVQADYGLLRQSIETLTNNAVARASRVWMNVAPFEGWAVLDIADNGPGFDEELLPHVFDRFRRGDTGGSSGLGLAIARSIIDSHRGRIEVSNRRDGGALVRVFLPLG
jgi:signal transduction histidine kinase